MTHPVIRALRDDDYPDAEIDNLLRHGRAFRPARLPSGVQQQQAGNCYQHAGRLALAGTGRYVEGYAMLPGHPVPIAHAWVTITGSDAVDVSWPYSEGNQYFGTVQTREAVRAMMARRGLVSMGRMPDIVARPVWWPTLRF